MTKEKDYQWMVGKLFHTPFEPPGLVKVLDFEPEEYILTGQMVLTVEFIDDHPMGYKAGSQGCYFADELRYCDE